MNLTRRNFIKLGIFSTLSLCACNEERHINEWVSTGQIKLFDIGEHVITVDEEYDYVSVNNQVEVPDGYSLIDTQEIVDSYGKFGGNTKTVGTTYIFVNDYPVEAIEYIFYNNYGEEVKKGYPFAGSPIQKVLVREGR